MHPSAGGLDQLVLAELSASSEARRRAHLRGCARCRQAYDERIVLHRALAGDPQRPTRAEVEGLIRRAVAGAQLGEPALQTKPVAMGAPAPGLAEFLLWHPGVLAASLTICLLVTAIALWPRRPPAPPLTPAATAEAPAATPPPAPSTAPEGPAARIATARGVRLDGRAAEKGATIQAGSTLEVDRGPAEIAVARGGTIRLFPGTTLTVGADGERLNLARGKVWCLVEPNGRPFTVVTPLGEARAVGTSYIVEQRDDSMNVRVLQGTVEVEDRDHRGVVRVHPEQQTRLRAGEAPAAPRHYASARDRSDWDDLVSSFLRTLKRIFDGK